VTAITVALDRKNSKSSLEASMPVELDQAINCPTLKPCAGPCGGYGTRCYCPPMIVLAVAATQNIAPLPSGVAG
jgi:predicted metal-binding protein